MEAFHNIREKPYEGVKKEAQKTGKKVIGWVCTYVPEEIIHAAGYLPTRVFGERGDTPQADAHLYSNVCSFSRGCLEGAFHGDFQFLEGIVGSNSCDNMRRLFDMWSHYVPIPFRHFIKVPHKLSDGALKFFQGEFVDFKEALERHSGKKIDEKALASSIRVFNKSRKLLRRLYQRRDALKGSEVLEIVLAGQLFPKEKYNELLEPFVERVAKEKLSQNGGQPRLLLVGSEVDDPHYVEVIEDAGAKVVMDDLCTGSRYFWDLVDESLPPMEALARCYLNHAPCARMRPTSFRVDHLKELIRDYQVDGIILEVIKFCDLYGEDYPLLKEGLKELDIPILALDREYNLASVGQMKTRIQAFLETLGG